MIRFGFVTDIDAAKCRVKVRFPDDELPSGFIPVLVPGAGPGDKFFGVPAVNSHVACIMEENMDNGVCLGAIYDSSNLPESSTKNQRKINFADGSQIVYDSQTSELSIQVGTYEINVSPTKLEFSKAGESLKSILAEILAQLQIETHVSAAPGSPTTPPVNVASYVALAGRVNLFFGA